MHASLSLSPSAACWSCGAAAGGGHFCSACGKIQPLAPEAGYFAFFGLPEKLGLDVEDLEQRYLALNWKLHPDNFVRAADFERNLSLGRSSEMNDAYRTLRDPVARVEYLLARHGARKEGQTKQQAPPELLEEVFELNESLEELREARESGGDTAELKERLESAATDFQAKLAEADAKLQAAFREWDLALDRSASQDERDRQMARMNEILNRRSYVRNLVANVSQELEVGS